MPLVVGGAAIAIIFLAMLSLVFLYWLSHNAAQATINWPLVGQQLSGAFTWFRDRNLELLRDVVGIAHGIISWAVDMVYNGVQWVHDIFFAPWYATINDLVAQMLGVRHWIDTWVNTNILKALSDVNTLSSWVHGWVQVQIDALNFWSGVVQSTLNTFIIPNINRLIIAVNVITGITIPTIQVRLGVAERTINVTLPAEIAEAKTDISAVQRVIGQTITAPKTGLLDRTKTVEGEIAQVLPWAAAIGLTIPIAANLAKLGRNPCWCNQEGPLQDNGTLELATLMDLI